ncbi:MAG: alkaline phosphatase D family protein [Rhodoferax sp.]|uniref:alkaline phosphatase D family protein n=1 Tax=Rhodoferax sp. TaxID=50421 RepID=UPI0013FF301A|nr:alkaline phosphatase D family protein [Rhodoferax sp.]NDP39841.1 alkaline phosphatase D family protein [Rhodoferax sp.]
MHTPHASRRQFVVRLASLATLASTGAALTACGGGNDPEPPRFDHGIASGDPLSDRVILWTHAQFSGLNDDAPLTWEVASDAAFSTLTASGNARATAATGHTVKVDATGLSAGKDYYFRFRWGQHSSPVGKTRTLPAAGSTSLALAVLSCSNYPAGYFHAYAEAAKSDAKYAVHLGDFIYEYAADGYASADAAALGRISQPATECLTLADYRKRYAQYRSDPDSKIFHASLPVIAVWDDHEVANDSFDSGAENHIEGAEGRFTDRRAAAVQAWHEWLPVRAPDAKDLLKIYRSFDFGGLAAMHMLETRLIGRDKQISFTELLNPATASTAVATLASPARSMMGAAQRGWLQAQMAASTATWQVLGQQVLMARMEFPVSVLTALNPDNTGADAVAAGQRAINDYLTAKATAAQAPDMLTDTQKALLNPAVNPQLGYNLDAWDGYPVEREIVLSTAKQLGKKLVVLAGDTHNAWASQLTLLDGSVVGHEFATSSVSSPGFEEYLPTLTPDQSKAIFLGVVDDLKFADTYRRGFMLMQFTPTQAKATWHFVTTVKERAYTVDASSSLTYQPS